MTITQNPTNSRLKYVWEKHKPPPHPEVMLDLIRAVGERLSIPWTDRIQKAADASGDAKFAATFFFWTHIDDTGDIQKETLVRSRGHGEFDRAFVDAVIAMVVEMPEFRKSHVVDGLIQWFAKTMNDLRTTMEEEKIAGASEAWRASAWRRYRTEYMQMSSTLARDPNLLDWFEKKKPNLSKLSAEDLLNEVEAFENDREPEVVYDGEGSHEDWDGWDVVQLKTKTQIQGVGEELDNCLKKGSSYTEGYCEAAKTGKSAFYALRKDGEPVLSIQWSPGLKNPEQVYGRHNVDPSGVASDRVNEWIESRGGTPVRWRNLTPSAREIAEHIDGIGGLDDESIEGYAIDWDEAFGSNREALAWIDAVGPYNLELANALVDAKLDADDFEALPAEVRDYLFDEDGRSDEADIAEAVTLGELYNEMNALSGAREQYAPKRVDDRRQVTFLERGNVEFAPSEAAIRAKQEKEADEALARSFTIPWGKPRKYGTWQTPPTPLMVEAKKWYDAGWTDRDYTSEAARWWSLWFDPDEAAIFFFDLASLGPQDEGISLTVAQELRRRGITATDVLDAARSVGYAGIRGRDVNSIVSAVEKYKLSPNKRRRSSRRR